MKWDHKIDYDNTRLKLAADILRERDLVLRDATGNPDDIDPQAKVRLSWDSCYLTQIVAGCRASEALDAWLTWIRTGERFVRVRVRKRAPPCKVCSHTKTSRHKDVGHEVLQKGTGLRGKCKKPGCLCAQYVANMEKVKQRLIVIPEECLDVDRPHFLKYVDRMTIHGYKHFAKRHIANTHSARYSLINKMTRDGASTVVISKTTGQTEAQVSAYQDEQEAERLLIERAKAPTPLLETASPPSP
jgi:hypothetical protein